MFYIDKLKDQIALAIREGDHDGSMCYLNVPRSTLAHAAWLAEQAQAELPWLERCAALCESLGIDEDNMAALELMMADNGRYRSERSDMIDRIREAAGEIISDARERECDDAIAALEAAGFVVVERDDFEGWERTGVAPAAEQVTIETKRRGRDFWYEFTYDERANVETLRGKSGQFGELLKAVGISQEVKK